VIRRHVGAEALAAFRDGDGDRRKAAGIRAHLARCPRCAALSRDLGDVTALLAGAQAPPMPEHLAARIQTALQSEAARRATLADAPAPVRQPQRAPLATRPGRRRSRRPVMSGPVALRTLAAAAAVAVLAGGGYEIAQHVGGASAAPSSGKLSLGTRSPAAGPTPAFGPALQYQHAGHAASVTPIATETDFAAGRLRQQVATELASYRAETALRQSGLRAGSPMSTVPTQRAGVSNRTKSFRNLSLTTLDGCIIRISAGQTVLLVDVARYQGAQATVIVVEASSAGPEQVSVVGPGCSAARSDLLARTTLPVGG
jgi:hypothetical protein